MAISSSNLLSALASSAHLRADVDPCSKCAEDLDFGELLAMAQSGRIGGNQLVQIAPGVGLELTPLELAEISRAADAADAAGLQRTLAVFDGQAMTIDVASRTIDGVIGGDDQLGELVTGIDSAVVLTSMKPEEASDEEEASARRLGAAHFVLEGRAAGSLGRVSNGALAEALAGAGVTLKAAKL